MEVEETLEDLREAVEAISVDQGWEEGQIILEGCREEEGTRGTLVEVATIEEILGEVAIPGETLAEIGEAIGIGEGETECNFEVKFFTK